MAVDCIARVDHQSLIDAIRKLVGNAGIVLGADMDSYMKGARYGSGQAACVVRPATRDEVAAIVELCVFRRVQVVPQGANTGLVGASTPDASGTQIILSLGRLRRQCEIDLVNRTVNVDAGFLLHELNDRLEPHGLWFPIDLAADPTVGGMIATNTGGTRLLRYGDVRHNLLAIEAVLFDPPGQMVRFGSVLRKNNTGFDLKQLFVGTSGVAGIVTGATLEVAAKPQQSVTALLVPACDDEVATLLVAIESRLGDFLSAFEGISFNAMRAALDHVPTLRNPFGNERIPAFSILIELSSIASEAQSGLNLEQLLMEFLEDRLGKDVTNAVLGRGHELWQLRHSLSEGARALGKPIGIDVSVRRSDVMRFRREAIALVDARYPQFTIVDFGHVGDGGLHFNLVWRNDCADLYSTAVVDEVREDIYDLVVTHFDGSYSAEHGIGPHNHSHYLKYASPSTLDLSGKIQRLLDPEGLSGRVRFGKPQATVVHT